MANHVTQNVTAMVHLKSSFRIPTVTILLSLLIFTPLIYSNDGDLYRAFKVVTVAMLFVLIATPKVFRLALWIQSGTAYVLAITIAIAVQPAFVAGADPLYNLKFMVVLLSCFLPTLYLSNCPPTRTSGGIVFVPKALAFLFGLSVISLIISALTGVGEVYTEGGDFQQRAFSWLGDSFSPVMVFFLFYYAFKGHAIGIFLSTTCLFFVMQAKMAAGMAAFGYLLYLFMIGKWSTRLPLGILVALGILSLPTLSEFIALNIHNFDYSVNNRFLSYETGLTYFLSSPWFGVGVNQTYTLMGGNFDVSVLDGFDGKMLYYEIFQIDNAYLRILAELGLIGFLIFIAFCMAIIRRCFFVLRSEYKSPPSNSRAISMACALWLISFILIYQTTGWFEPGHPQLSWLICFLTLMNFVSRSKSGINTVHKTRKQLKKADCLALAETKS